MNAETAASEAYNAWELKEFAVAAELFLRASPLESEAAKARGKWAAPDQSVLHRLRAGYCLFEDGKLDDALELLKEGLALDWKAMRLWGDRYDAEKCHVRHILYYAMKQDRARYGEHLKLAIDDGARLEIPFPWSVPCQKQFLTAAIALEDCENLTSLLAAIDSKRLRENPELALICRAAENVIAQKRGAAAAGPASIFPSLRNLLGRVLRRRST